MAGKCRAAGGRGRRGQAGWSQEGGERPEGAEQPAEFREAKRCQIVLRLRQVIRRVPSGLEDTDFGVGRVPGSEDGRWRWAARMGDQERAD